MPARRCLAVLALASACGALARAQDLAVRRYGVADGLANARVNHIYQDTRGFLWIATWEGLNRFDGERFRIYGARDGLASLVVNAVREDRAGRLWVGTNGSGVARLEEERDAHPRFSVFPVDSDPQANNVNAILFDGSGAMWCHTDAGVYLARTNAQDPPRFECLFAGRPETGLNWSRCALRDRSGRVWFGIGRELLSGSTEGLVRCAMPPRVDPRGLVALAEDGRGRVVAADSRALFVLRSETLPRGEDDWERLPLALAQGQEIRELLLTRPVSCGLRPRAA